jgi:Protein of unknown function (DUF2800)
MTGTHSILAPSGSERWLRCVGSLRLCKDVPSEASEHAASGTLSHWMLESALNGDALESWLGKSSEVEGFKFTVDQDRIDLVQSVVNAINREPGLMLTETRLDTTPVLGVPGQQGHSDVIKANPTGSVLIDDTHLHGVLSVHDFKSGYNQVNARDNTQGLIYLCAAMIQVADLIGDYNAFRFCIHQPKINHYDEWTYTRAELVAFMDLIRPVAKLAYDLYHGTVEFDPVKHLNAGDTQCGYCPVRGRCPARAKRVADMFLPLIKRHELDDAAIGALYSQLDEIESAVSDFRAEALRRAKMGSTIPGQKLIYGNRGRRQWIDTAQAERALTGIAGERAYEPRTIISPTDAEKMLKKRYAALVPLVTQTEPQLRLVPLSHKGEEVKIETFRPQEPST